MDEQEAHKEEERVSKKDISKLNQEDSQIKKNFQTKKCNPTDKEFRMNKLNAQKFMSLFNTMLTDRNGNKVELKKQENIMPLNLDKKGDEVDMVTAQKEEQLNDRLNERNLLFLKKVEAAQQKIADGTYGICEDCGSTISQKRLLARPTACLCIGCQEEKERENFGSFKHRRDLNSKKITAENDGYIQEKKFTSVKDIGWESVVDM